MGEQAIVPGFGDWERDERAYLARIERDRAQLALDSALSPTARRQAGALPLFDEDQPKLF